LVSLIEASVIEYLKESGVNAERKLDAPGVYVDNQKIAALGLRVKKHRTYHGLALNVDMDLMPFKGINPCGIKGMVSTQLIDFKRDITLNEVKQGLSKYLLRYLDQTSTIISDVA
jgi:lipoyl(octanoyl) transferase